MESPLVDSDSSFHNPYVRQIWISQVDVFQMPYGYKKCNLVLIKPGSSHARIATFQ